MSVTKTAGAVGAMRHKVEIQERRIRGGSTDHEEIFTTEATVQAQIKTLGRGIEVFDDTNTSRTASHAIVMRHRAGLTAENWILFDGRRFDILSIVFVDERKRFQRLLCVERGNEAFQVNRR